MRCLKINIHACNDTIFRINRGFIILLFRFFCIISTFFLNSFIIYWLRKILFRLFNSFWNIILNPWVLQWTIIRMNNTEQFWIKLAFWVILRRNVFKWGLLFIDREAFVIVFRFLKLARNESELVYDHFLNPVANGYRIVRNFFSRSVSIWFFMLSAATHFGL